MTRSLNQVHATFVACLEYPLKRNQRTALTSNVKNPHRRRSRIFALQVTLTRSQITPRFNWLGCNCEIQRKERVFGHTVASLRRRPSSHRSLSHHTDRPIPTLRINQTGEPVSHHRHAQRSAPSSSRRRREDTIAHIGHHHPLGNVLAWCGSFWTGLFWCARLYSSQLAGDERDATPPTQYWVFGL